MVACCSPRLAVQPLDVSPLAAFVTSFPLVYHQSASSIPCATWEPSLRIATPRRRRTKTALLFSSFACSSLFARIEMRRRKNGTAGAPSSVRACAATVDSPLPSNPTDDDSLLGAGGTDPLGDTSAAARGIDGTSEDSIEKSNSNTPGINDPQSNLTTSSSGNTASNSNSKVDDNSQTISTSSAGADKETTGASLVPSQTEGKLQKLPNKWVVAAVASSIHALHATAVYMAPSTLLSPMRASLNLSVAEITRPLIIYRLVQTGLLFPAGFFISDVGPQFCLRIAIISAALTAPLLAFVQTLPQLIFLQSFYSLTKLFGGLSPLLMIVSSAFPDGKGIGTATAIVLSGYSFAGFLAPAFIGSIAGILGWRTATLILSLIFSVLSVPFTLHYLRNREPYPSIGECWRAWRRRWSPSSSSSSSNASSSLATSDASKLDPESNERVFTFPYATIFVAVAAFSFSMNLVFDHIILFLGEDMKMSFHVATRYLSALNLISLFGKLATGPLADRFNMTLLLVIFGIGGAFSCLLLLDISLTTGIITVTQSAGRALAFICMYSLFYSGTFNLTTAILPEFGRKKMAIRSNLNLVALFGAGSLGSWMAARWRSTQGSYKWPFMWNVFCFAIVALCALFKYFVFDRPAAVASKLSQSATGQTALPAAAGNNIKQD